MITIIIEDNEELKSGLNFTALYDDIVLKIVHKQSNISVTIQPFDDAKSLIPLISKYIVELFTDKRAAANSTKALMNKLVDNNDLDEIITVEGIEENTPKQKSQPQPRQIAAVQTTTNTKLTQDELKRIVDTSMWNI